MSGRETTEAGRRPALNTMASPTWQGSTPSSVHQPRMVVPSRIGMTSRRGDEGILDAPLRRVETQRSPGRTQCFATATVTAAPVLSSLRRAVAHHPRRRTFRSRDVYSSRPISSQLTSLWSMRAAQNSTWLEQVNYASLCTPASPLKALRRTCTGVFILSYCKHGAAWTRHGRLMDGGGGRRGSPAGGTTTSEGTTFGYRFATAA